MSSQPTPRCEKGAKQPRFHMRVCAPGHQSSIAPMVQGLMDVVKETDCAAGKEFEVEIALQEALANAVVHGCRNDPAKVVECELSCRGVGELVMVVRDPGPGFDPASVPNPTADENIHSTHGRGIYLIRQVVDEAWFERGGSEIHMVVKRADSSPGAPALRLAPACLKSNGDRT